MDTLSESTIGEKLHLVFEGVSAQGPAMAEDDRLSLTPVLVIEMLPEFSLPTVT
jgi:hypothetical protein